ncbi:MAG: hypothetical protein ACI4M9_03590, partial [Succinivibrio sp.]
MSDKKSFLELLKEQEHPEKDNFSSMLEGEITPIVQDKIATKAKLIDKDQAKARQQSAVRKKEDVTDSASSGFVVMVKPDDILEYRRPGIQPFVMQKLRKGEYKVMVNVNCLN